MPAGLPEPLENLNPENDPENDVHKWNEQEQNIPDRHFGDLEENDDVINGNDRRPSRLSCFGVDPPHGCQVKNDDGQINDDQNPCGCFHDSPPVEPTYKIQN